MITLNENHEYFVDSKRVAGVSEILTHFGFNDFSKVPEHYLTPAVEFGQVVHKIVEMTENNDTSNFDDDHKIIQKHWEDFKNYVDLKNCLVDLKTFARPKTSNILQIFAYRILIHSGNEALWNNNPQVEKIIHSEIWNFCGKPDYFKCQEGIKKLYILTIPDLNGFDPKKNVFTYDGVKDKTWEDEFKTLLKVYQIQQREGILK